MTRRHGDALPERTVPIADPVVGMLGSDPTLGNVNADMAAYLVLERELCHCDALCTCGWDW